MARPTFPFTAIFRVIALLLLTLSVCFVILSQSTTKPAKPPLESKLFNVTRLLSDLQKLSADDMEGRGTGTPGIIKAQEFILSGFKEAGLTANGGSFLQEFPVKLSGKSGNPKGVNIIGYLKGKNDPEKYIIITAHYDHLGVKNGQIFNGADDNASGTAALFAIASYFKEHRPANSLIFVAFDAEEIGLQGSRHFVSALPVAKESVLLNVNLDMISHNDRNELYVSGAFHYPWLKPHLDSVKAKARVKLLTGHDTPELKSDDWTNQSDHFPFHLEKIPFIYFGVEDHKDYHKATDEFQNINQDFYIRAVETIIETVAILDKNWTR